jgi:hypothetical protein
MITWMHTHILGRYLALTCILSCLMQQHRKKRATAFVGPWKSYGIHGSPLQLLCQFSQNVRRPPSTYYFLVQPCCSRYPYSRCLITTTQNSEIIVVSSFLPKLEQIVLGALHPFLAQFFDSKLHLEVYYKLRYCVSNSHGDNSFLWDLVLYNDIGSIMTTVKRWYIRASWSTTTGSTKSDTKVFPNGSPTLINVMHMKTSAMSVNLGQ